VVSGGVIQTFTICDQHTKQRAQFEQLMPISVVAREAGCIQAWDQASFTQTHFSNQCLEAMGDRFAEVWQSDHCAPTLRKMIFRTAIEEIVVRTDQDKRSLELVMHWKGGAHTQLTMERPRSATETATPMEALDIIRCMAVRYGDDQIASVLNRRGYYTGKGKRWNQTRVATARRNHTIAGQKRAVPDLERVSLNEAARICGVSHSTIERLVEAGLLKHEQVTPRAPWEIRRSDLDAAPIRRIVDRLHRTGKLTLQGGCAEDQFALFTENAGIDNARYHE